MRAIRGIRAFVAVPLPEPIQARLFTVAGALAQQLSGVKAPRKRENFHVTIRFLGQVPEDRVAELGAALGRALGDVRPFEIGVRGIGAFPSARKANVIWAGIDDPAARLVALAGMVESTIGGIGIGGEGEARPFRPHVTIGRAKAGVDARAELTRVSDQVFGRFVVGEVHLFESRRGSEGSTYLSRSRVALHE